MDFSRWLNGAVFAPLRDRDCFARFFLDGGSVKWQNGADIAPETLHEVARTSSLGDQIS